MHVSGIYIALAALIVTGGLLPALGMGQEDVAVAEPGLGLVG